MSESALAPNKIHRLPVKVIYHLPSSSQTYSTFLSGTQSVYVHQRAGSSQQDESWGSMNLKAVVRGICFASPEIVPSFDTPDSSIYVLDPRETHMRKSRPSFSPNLASPSLAPTEVWTGKGMLTWAIGEAGDGKTLVTGRLVEFTKAADDGLDALVMGGDCLEWGLEVSLGVKSVLRAADDLETACTPLDGLFGRTVTILPPSTLAVSTPAPELPSAKLSVPDRVSVKREMSATPDPTALPSKLLSASYKDPSALTEAQAQRLLASPHFLTLLNKMTNGDSENTPPQPSTSASTSAMGNRRKKRKADGQVLKESQKQPTAHGHGAASQQAGYVCYNCGRTRSAVWRMKEADNGEQQRVCNACGLYWNKNKQMRPPELWEGVDEEISKRPRADKNTQEPSSSVGTFARPRQSEKASGTGFKRTLTMVAEHDAKRLTHGRRGKAINATSPVRASASVASSAIRRESSPGTSWKPQPRRTTTKRAPVQSLDLPLSDDADTPVPQAGGWDQEYSAFFNIEEYAPVRQESPPPTGGSSPEDQTSTFLRQVSSGQRQLRQKEQSLRSEDDGFSELFRATSSVAPSSSPLHIPFDMSSLPPSSPPIGPRRSFAPSSPARPTPKAITPDVDLYGNPIGPSPAETHPKTPYENPDLQALLNMLSDGNPSSTGIVDGDLDLNAFLSSFVTE